MKKILIAFLCITLLPALALANGLNLNSLGSRALAMGGAFVGLADDFSAIYWNPAGMSQFSSKTFGFFGTDIIPSGTYMLEIPMLGTVDAKTQAKHYLSGMAAYYHPINDKIVAGLSVYVPSGLGASWDGGEFMLTTYPYLRSYENMSKVGLVTIAPGLSYKINDMFAVGVALNVNYGMFDIKRWAGDPAVMDLGQFEMSLTGWGLGATVGLLVKPSDMISLGVTYRTASKISFKGETSIANLGLLGLPNSSEVELGITWPQWVAAGVAVRPIPNLIITGDLQWSDWAVVDKIELDYTDTLWQMFTAAAGQNEIQMRWKSALQIRFGLEYKLTQSLFLRGGYYNDPSPVPDQTIMPLLPSFNFNVVTAGLGYALNGLTVDLGFEYLMGQERSVSLVQKATDPDFATSTPGTYGMNIMVPNISVSYKF
jgi:long-chain fatty acid transport protein